jgi:hypothetical protein
MYAKEYHMDNSWYNVSYKWIKDLHWAYRHNNNNHMLTNIGKSFQNNMYILSWIKQHVYH